LKKSKFKKLSFNLFRLEPVVSYVIPQSDGNKSGLKLYQQFVEEFNSDANDQQSSNQRHIYLG